MNLFKIIGCPLLLLLGFSCTKINGQNKLSADGFEQLIVATPYLQLLDVRTPQEFAESHIAEARNMDINSADFSKKIASLDKEKPVAVYCAAGGRSGRAAAMLLEQGFKNVSDLKGGLGAWKTGQKRTVK